GNFRGAGQAGEADRAATADDLPDLKAMLIASEARNQRKDERIERLEKLVAAFRQATFLLAQCLLTLTFSPRSGPLRTGIFHF
ncbi:MAG: hypothetical protein KDK08_16405, partial [Rhizobiaceae bacterium]|nr:hypothetical protein [Rhizobiaceae bacterium]